MFFEWLERQRAKPESERRVMAVLLSFIITGGIALVWFATMVIEPAPEAPQEAVAPREFEGGEEVRTAFELIGARFRDFRDALSEGFPSSVEYEQAPSVATTSATTSELVLATSTATTTSR